MANARTQFDAIAGYLERVHEARTGQLYGKPAIFLNGQAFAAFATETMAFRLHGRALTQALALPGARRWDPLRAESLTSSGWIAIPGAQALRWNRLALDALRCAREAGERRVSYAAPTPSTIAALPPASTPSSLAQRVAAAIASGFRSFGAGR